MRLPIWLMIVDLLFLLALTVATVWRVRRIIAAKDGVRPLPVPLRVLGGAGWLLVAIDLFGMGEWGLAFGPLIFSAMTFGAGPAYRWISGVLHG